MLAEGADTSLPGKSIRRGRWTQLHKCRAVTNMNCILSPSAGHLCLEQHSRHCRSVGSSIPQHRAFSLGIPCCSGSGSITFILRHIFLKKALQPDPAFQMRVNAQGNNVLWRQGRTERTATGLFLQAVTTTSVLWGKKTDRWEKK